MFELYVLNALKDACICFLYIPGEKVNMLELKHATSPTNHLIVGFGQAIPWMNGKGVQEVVYRMKHINPNPLSWGCTCDKFLPQGMYTKMTFAPQKDARIQIEALMRFIKWPIAAQGPELNHRAGYSAHDQSSKWDEVKRLLYQDVLRADVTIKCPTSTEGAILLTVTRHKPQTTLLLSMRIFRASYSAQASRFFAPPSLMLMDKSMVATDRFEILRAIEASVAQLKQLGAAIHSYTATFKPWDGAPNTNATKHAQTAWNALPKPLLQ